MSLVGLAWDIKRLKFDEENLALAADPASGD